MVSETVREGGLEAPKREPIPWKEAEYWDADALEKELERVYDVCHGCRRCLSLCDAFPTLFDLVDESPTMEVDGVDKKDYGKVVDQCYLCDLCAETKCPYLPPHEWAIDFPHLMLQAKAQKFKAKEPKWQSRVFSNADGVMKVLGAPVVAQTVNTLNKSKTFRKVTEKALGFHRDAPLPEFHSRKFKSSGQMTKAVASPASVNPCERTTGKAAFFVTCYGNTVDPQINADMASVFTHNNIALKQLEGERCCGMTKLEIGDLEAVSRLKEHNIPRLAKAVDDGWDLVAPIPSCVLMFKQEIPLMFPDDPEVQKVKERFFDPFEYLALRHKAGLLNTEFKNSPGHIVYQVACHQRVQNIGLKTRDVLALIPDVKVTLVERCSGHDGSYALRLETYTKAMKIASGALSRMRKAKADAYTSDCPMAGRFLAHGLGDGSEVGHPMSLLRQAYAL